MGCQESNDARSPGNNSKAVAGIWPQGKIYYIMNIGPNSGALFEIVYSAIKIWNQANHPYCQFIQATPEQQYYVIFQQNDTCCPHSQVGCWFRKDQTINLPSQYPIGNQLSTALVLHEMMHCAGFEHETYSYDGQQHLKLQHTEKNTKVPGLMIGMYDKQSIMHNAYIEGVNLMIDQFSQTDLLALRKLYTSPKKHHGSYHNACSSGTCSNTECNCGNCGELYSLGFNCGYQGGFKGHWTCCFTEDKEKYCMTTHVGYWHPACDLSKGCTEIKCNCLNCGGGCTYKGRNGHWSCCNREGYKTQCVRVPYA